MHSSYSSAHYLRANPILLHSTHCNCRSEPIRKKNIVSKYSHHTHLIALLEDDKQNHSLDDSEVIRSHEISTQSPEIPSFTECSYLLCR